MLLYNVACVYAIEGMRDDAISCLERAIDKGYGHKEWILHDSDLNSLRNDKRFKELGLDPANYVSREQVVTLLLRHPELMERPVVIRGNRAVIARPSEKVLDLLD